LILGIFIIEVNSFIPVRRVFHSSVLVGTKLYIFGRAISDGTDELNEVIYLDISQSFNSENPSWTLQTEMPFESSFATVSLIDINNNPTTYLFDGFMFDPISHNDLFVSFIHTFNPQNLQ